MGHHDQGGLLGSGTLARAQQDGIEVQAPCGGGGGRVRAQQGRVRALLPPVLTVLGVLLLRGGLQGADAPADAGHGGCILQAHPLHLRLLARAGQDSDSLRGEKLQCQRLGGWGSLWGRGRHRTSVGGQLGVENLATRRSRSMVRTDQLPWGAPGEDGRLRAAGRTSPSPSPSTARHSMALTGCQRGRGTRLCVHHKHVLGAGGQSPAGHRHGPATCPRVPASPYLLAALGRVQHKPPAVGRPAQRRQGAAVDAGEGACGGSVVAQHPLHPISPELPAGPYSPHACRGTASSTVRVCSVYQSYCGTHGPGGLCRVPSCPPAPSEPLPGAFWGPAAHHEEAAALLVGPQGAVLQVGDAAAVGAEPRGPHGPGVIREQLCEGTRGR